MKSHHDQILLLLKAIAAIAAGAIVLALLVQPALPLVPSLPVVVLAAYLVGSIPFGVLVARLMRLGDLSRIGSGNIGATNVLRTGNRAAAALTLLLDIGKGSAAVALGFQATRQLGTSDTMAMACGFAAFAGHLYPVWLGFRGGKGVATFMGVLLLANFLVGLAACATWLAVAAASRYSSLASMTSALAAAILFWIVDPAGTALSFAPHLCALMTLLIFWKHRPNIRRLWSGTESKIHLGSGTR